jgi:hypothetical protein
LKEDDAARRLDHTEDETENRGLSHATLADDDEPLLRIHCQRDVFQNSLIPELLSYVSQFYDV